MLNCAICDDDKGTVLEAEAILRAALRESGCAAHISTYTDSRLFMSDIVDYQPFDLVILDVEMPHFDGREVAACLRRHFPECCILFLTSHVQYAVESYELQIFRYTPKSELVTKLPRYIKEATALLLLQNGQTYTVCKNDVSERLPYRQMLCVRKDGKYSVISCADGREIRIRKPIREVAQELDPEEFLCIDRGCLVNIAMISRIEGSDVICKNGERLPISRSQLKETTSKITQYWGEKL